MPFIYLICSVVEPACNGVVNYFIYTKIISTVPLCWFHQQVPVTQFTDCNASTLITSITVYGAVLASGGIIYKPYQTKYPVTTVGCNVTDSSQLANLTSPVFDPIVYNPQAHFRFVM